MHTSFLQVELPPADLGPTSTLSQSLQLLQDVLASHDSSVVPLDARQQDFNQVCIIDTIIDPTQDIYSLVLFTFLYFQ